MKNSILPSIRCTEKFRLELENLAHQQGRTLSNMILNLLKIGIENKK